MCVRITAISGEDPPPSASQRGAELRAQAGCGLAQSPPAALLGALGGLRRFLRSPARPDSRSSPAGARPFLCFSLRLICHRSEGTGRPSSPASCSGTVRCPLGWAWGNPIISNPRFVSVKAAYVRKCANLAVTSTMAKPVCTPAPREHLVLLKELVP